MIFGEVFINDFDWGEQYFLSFEEIHTEEQRQFFRVSTCQENGGAILMWQALTTKVRFYCLFFRQRKICIWHWVNHRFLFILYIDFYYQWWYTWWQESNMAFETLSKYVGRLIKYKNVFHGFSYYFVCSVQE